MRGREREGKVREGRERVVKGREGKRKEEKRREEKRKREREQFHQLEQVQHNRIGFYMDPSYEALGSLYLGGPNECGTETLLRIARILDNSGLSSLSTSNPEPKFKLLQYFQSLYLRPTDFKYCVIPN